MRAQDARRSRASGAEPAGARTIARVHTRGVHRRDRAAPATARTATGPGSATARATTRSSTGCTRRPPLVAVPSVAAAEAVWSGRPDHAFNAAGRPPPRDAGARERVLRLRRSRRSRSRGSSSAGPSASPTSTSTSTTATGRRRSSGTTRACSRSRSTSTAAVVLPGTGGPVRARRPVGAGQRDQRPAAAGTGDAGWLRRVPRRRPRRRRARSGPTSSSPSSGATRTTSDPLAQLRAHDGRLPARRRATVHGLAHDVCRRTLGRDRRRRLPVGAGGPARLDALVRRDGRRRRRPRRRAAAGLGPSARRSAWDGPVPTTFCETAARSLAGRRGGASRSAATLSAILGG